MSNENKKTKYDAIPAKNNMEISKEEVEDDILEKKTLDKVVTADVKKEKKTLAGRFIKGVAGPEGFTGIGDYVKDEVILPAVKNIVTDTFTGVLGMLQDSIMSTINYKLFGDSGPGYNPRQYNQRRDPHVGPRLGARPVTSYQTRPSAHGTTNRQHSRTANLEQRPRLVEDYILEDRDDAARVIHLLIEYADTYNQVSVADYYDLIGVESVHTDYGFGWTLDEIHRTTMRSVSGGWVVVFPPALKL